MLVITLAICLRVMFLHLLPFVPSNTIALGVSFVGVSFRCVTVSSVSFDTVGDTVGLLRIYVERDTILPSNMYSLLIYLAKVSYLLREKVVAREMGRVGKEKARQLFSASKVAEKTEK